MRVFRRASLVSATIVLTLAPLILVYADDFHIEDSGVVSLYRSLQDQARKDMAASSQPDRGPWTEWPEYIEAQRTKNSDALKATLKPFIQANPENPAVFGAIEQMVNACRNLDNQVEADTWSTKGVQGIENYLLNPTTKADGLLYLQLHRRLSSMRSAYSDDDYALEKDFLSRLLDLPQYAEWKDMIWDALCSLEYSRGHYSEVRRFCDLIDDYYKTLPDSERGRLLHNQWRARAMFKAGHKKEAIEVFENLAKDRYAVIRKDVFFREIEEMRKELAKTEAASGGSSGP